jgi:hypothetical protein
MQTPHGYRRLWFLTAVLVTILCIAGSTAAARPLPTQIDDKAYWRMVTDFSEPGGSFSAENFVSNEPNFQVVLTRLKATVKPGGAYLGVGPEQNFTYIAALKPGIAFIVDIRRQNLIQHLMYKAIFELSDDRTGFLSILFSRKPPAGLGKNPSLEGLFAAYKSEPGDPELEKRGLQAIEDVLNIRHGFGLSAPDLETLEHVHHIFQLYGPETGYASNLRTVDFTNGGGNNGNMSTILTTTDDGGVNRSFLSTEENFRFMKDFESRNLVVPVVGDFGGQKALRAIAQYLKEQEATLAAFYVSNVEQYLFQANPTSVNGGAGNFYENVAVFPVDGTSTFIRAANDPNVRQTNKGFTSHLGSIQETVQVFRQKGLRTLREVFDLSR